MPQAQGEGGSPLAQLRRSRGLSQEELAELSGVSARSIRNLERGIVERPRKATLHALAGAFGLDDAATDRLVTDFRQPAPVLSGPAQLPPADAGFIGRTSELAELHAVMESGGGNGQILIVEGNGGLGKTQLALHWARSVETAFPDGQLFARLHGFGSGTPTKPSDILGDFLIGLGVQPASMPGNLTARSALFRSLVAGRHMLVVLDDAADHEQIEPVLPGTHTCTTVITTRRRMVVLAAQHGAHRLQLEPMPTTDAAAVLSLGGTLAGTESEHARALRACGGLPLALRILACQAQDHGWSHVLNRLDTRAALDAVGTPVNAMDVRQVLSTSVELLDEPELMLFTLIGLVSTPDVSWHALAAMADVSIGDVKETAEGLVALHLASPREGHLVVHDLVQKYAAELGADWPVEQSEGALRRLTALVIDTAEAARRAQRPPAAHVPQPPPLLRIDDLDLPSQPMNWLTSESELIRDSIDFADSLRSDVLTLRLADALWDRLDHIRQEFDAHGLFVGAVEAARDAGDRAGLTRSLGYLGQFMARSGDWLSSESLLREAVQLAEQTGDRLSEGDLLFAFAQAHYLVGRYQLALDELQRAAELRASGGWAIPDDVVQNNVALLKTYLGEYDDAEQILRGRLSAQSAAGDENSRCLTLGNLATIKRLRGDLRGAERDMEAALPLARTSADHTGLAWALIDAATIAVELGKLHPAGDFLAEADRLIPADATLRMRNWHGNTSAELLAAQGDLAGARAGFTEVALRARQGHDRLQLTRAITGLRALDSSARDRTSLPS